MPSGKSSRRGALREDTRALRRLFSQGETVVLSVWGNRAARSHVESVLNEKHHAARSEQVLLANATRNYDGSHDVKEALNVVVEGANIYLATRMAAVLEQYLEEASVNDGLLRSVSSVLCCVDSDRTYSKLRCAFQRAGNLAGVLSLYRDLKEGFSEKSSLKLALDFLGDGGPRDVSKESRGEVKKIFNDWKHYVDTGSEGDLRHLRAKGCKFLHRVFLAFISKGEREAARVVSKYLAQEPVHELVRDLRRHADSLLRKGNVTSRIDGRFKKKTARDLIKNRADDSSSEEDFQINAGVEDDDDDDGSGDDDDDGDTSGSVDHSDLVGGADNGSNKKGREIEGAGHKLFGNIADVDEDEFRSTDSDSDVEQVTKQQRALKKEAASGRNGKHASDTGTVVEIDPNVDEDMFASSGSDENEIGDGGRNSTGPVTPASPRGRRGVNASGKKAVRRELEPVSPFSGSEDRNRTRLPKKKRMSDQISPARSPEYVMMGDGQKRRKTAGGTPGKVSTGRGVPFSSAEDKLLLEGLRKYGWASWRLIVDNFDFNGRTNVALKDRARTLNLEPYQFPSNTGPRRGRPAKSSRAGGTFGPQRRRGAQTAPSDGDDIDENSSGDEDASCTEDDGDEAGDEEGGKDGNNNDAKAADEDGDGDGDEDGDEDGDVEASKKPDVAPTSSPPAKRATRSTSGGAV